MFLHPQAMVGSTQKVEERLIEKTHTPIDVTAMFGRVHKWLTMSSNAIDSEDARITEEASDLHAEMVRWMVRYRAGLRNCEAPVT